MLGDVRPYLSTLQLYERAWSLLDRNHLDTMRCVNVSRAARQPA